MTVRLTIGELSKMTYLSVKALRHYHDLGLLEPSEVDQASGYPVDEGASPDFAVIPGRPGWMFIRVPEAKAVKNRVHPDLAAPDLPAEVQRLKDLGATHLADHDEDGSVWSTLADPEGNEFDVVAG